MTAQLRGIDGPPSPCGSRWASSPWPAPDDVPATCPARPPHDPHDGGPHAPAGRPSDVEGEPDWWAPEPARPPGRRAPATVAPAATWTPSRSGAACGWASTRRRGCSPRSTPDRRVRGLRRRHRPRGRQGPVRRSGQHLRVRGHPPRPSGCRCSAARATPTTSQVDMVANTFTINCRRDEVIDFSSRVLHVGPAAAGGADRRHARRHRRPHRRRRGVRGRRLDQPRHHARPARRRPPVVRAAPPTRPSAWPCSSRARSTPSAPTTPSWPAWRSRTPTSRSSATPFSEEPYGLGLPPGHDDWVRYVNAVLDDVRTAGRWARSTTRLLADALDRQRPPAPTAQYATTDRHTWDRHDRTPTAWMRAPAPGPRQRLVDLESEPSSPWPGRRPHRRHRPPGPRPTPASPRLGDLPGARRAAEAGPRPTRRRPPAAGRPPVADRPGAGHRSGAALAAAQRASTRPPVASAGSPPPGTSSPPGSTPPEPRPPPRRHRRRRAAAALAELLAADPLAVTEADVAQSRPWPGGQRQRPAAGRRPPARLDIDLARARASWPRSTPTRQAAAAELAHAASRIVGRGGAASRSATWTPLGTWLDRIAPPPRPTRPGRRRPRRLVRGGRRPARRARRRPGPGPRRHAAPGARAGGCGPPCGPRPAPAGSTSRPTWPRPSTPPETSCGGRPATWTPPRRRCRAWPPPRSPAREDR